MAIPISDKGINNENIPKMLLQFFRIDNFLICNGIENVLEFGPVTIGH